jgi:hypothetical protein
MILGDPFAILAPIVLVDRSPLRALVTNLAWSSQDSFSRSV